MWVVYAVGSALFAALTSILAKIGIENVNSNLATAVRTVVVLVLAWGIVFFTGANTGIKNITQRSLLFLVLSGITTGLSWLFYYKAIQIGPVSKVAPIDKFSVVITIVLAFLFLHEKIDMKTILGGILITAGTFVLIL
ncbi:MULTISPECIES: EamA family transporter [unclassified Caproiciproducens]|uniref:EamA family transporter n=1 Tax=unclassified Caproiciproducens TaxID=2643836 RepID=UPI0023DCC886|nr:EamA family transporter [Caproiciproducens sp. CPB-2]MDF1493249.1 EamA family transporter [Caproiciproducens sp. CPB-2]